MSRPYRKNEHLAGVLREKPGRADFSDIAFVHNCLPDRDFDLVNLESSYLGRTYRSPLFINAITGGTDLATRINISLALVAKECGLPLAVGSQMVALGSSSILAKRSFAITRKLNPQGEIWANIGSYADPGMAAKAVKMIKANALQIHLNLPQELAMPEGERSFNGMIERIKAITAANPVPVIAKEVGFGIAAEQAAVLAASGVNAIDIGGKGGTNFLSVENRRSGGLLSAGTIKWGIPTAISLLEVNAAAGGKTNIFSSGGMHSPLDLAKALSMGADAIGMAGFPLYILHRYGRDALVRAIRAIEQELRMIIFMTGASSLSELRKVPLVITGYTAQWLKRRGFNPNQYSQRK
jgi:isopentenyl-diphosphate Delta-isomerase